MRESLCVLLIFVGTSLSLYGLLQYFGIFSHSWWVPQEFLSATYVNHNNFAGYLELIIPLAISVFMYEKTTLKTKLPLVIALVIMAAAFILTQSRGAWMSLSASLFVMAIIIGRDSPRRAKTIIVILLAALLILSFIYFSKELISQRLETVTTAASEEASFMTRIAIWKGAIRMIMDHPVVGTGIGTFASAFTAYRPEGLNTIANFTHNDYLNVAAEMGMAALFVNKER
ncbi:MAG: O-antigen ligase family protein, partial [Candidatus Omnitrophota bacterium]|nr:O-antigen ligase family protein [Candidatus Omnitrophota bacterium]